MTHVNATFAYRIPFPKSDTKLSFGIGVGAMFYNAKVTDLERVNEGDPLIGNNLNGVKPNLSAGVYYYGTKFYVGLSVPNFLPVSLTSKGFFPNSSNERLQQFTSLILMGGYTFEIGKKKNFWIQPQTLLKYTPSSKYELPLELDINVVFTFFKTLGIGATYRTGITDPYQNRESIDVMAIVYLPKNFTIGYAYDQTISKLLTYNKGTHEVLLGYDVNWKKKGIRTPRYF